MMDYQDHVLRHIVESFEQAELEVTEIKVDNHLITEYENGPDYPPSFVDTGNRTYSFTCRPKHV